jgi:ketosteroid isomerase-like protein
MDQSEPPTTRSMPQWPVDDPGPDSDGSSRPQREPTITRDDGCAARCSPSRARFDQAQLPCVAPPLAPHRSEEEDVTVDDAEAVIERSHLAWGEFVKGDPGHALQLFSHGDDVIVGNPFGPFVRGWELVSETVARAATYYRDGEVTGFERVATYTTAELACFVEVERYRAKIGGSEELSPVALRVTSVVRREDDGWRIVSRHADPISAARPPGSVIQRG